MTLNLGYGGGMRLRRIFAFSEKHEGKRRFKKMHFFFILKYYIIELYKYCNCLKTPAQM